MMEQLRQRLEAAELRRRQQLRNRQHQADEPIPWWGRRPPPARRNSRLQ
jgi:hypothetical protein